MTCDLWVILLFTAGGLSKPPSCWSRCSAPSCSSQCIDCPPVSLGEPSTNSSLPSSPTPRYGPKHVTSGWLVGLVGRKLHETGGDKGIGEREGFTSTKITWLPSWEQLHILRERKGNVCNKGLLSTISASRHLILFIVSRTKILKIRLLYSFFASLFDKTLAPSN